MFVLNIYLNRLVIHCKIRPMCLKMEVNNIAKEHNFISAIVIKDLT